MLSADWDRASLCEQEQKQPQDERLVLPLCKNRTAETHCNHQIIGDYHAFTAECYNWRSETYDRELAIALRAYVSPSFDDDSRLFDTIWPRFSDQTRQKIIQSFRSNPFSPPHKSWPGRPHIVKTIENYYDTIIDNLTNPGCSIPSAERFFLFGCALYHYCEEQIFDPVTFAPLRVRPAIEDFQETHATGNTSQPQACNLANAVSAFREATSREPCDRNRLWLCKSLLKYGKSLCRDGKYDESIKAFRERLDIGDDPATRGWLGRAYYCSGNFDKAVEVFCWLTRTSPTAENWYFLGWSLYRLRKYRRAAKAFRVSTRQSPRFEKGWFWLGRLYYRARKFTQAAWAFRRASRVKPTGKNCHWLGRARFQAGRYQGAMSALKKAFQKYHEIGYDEVDKYRNRIGLDWYWLGISQFKADHFCEAEETFKEVLRVENFRTFINDSVSVPSPVLVLTMWWIGRTMLGERDGLKWLERYEEGNRRLSGDLSGLSGRTGYFRDSVDERGQTLADVHRHIFELSKGIRRKDLEYSAVTVDLDACKKSLLLLADRPPTRRRSSAVGQQEGGV
jgi:tetratricopeptide (TPR) repeat protein